MRKSVFACVATTIVCCYWSQLNSACAQQPSLRYTGGWSTSNRAATSNAPQNLASSPVVQAAYYQSPGGGLPAYPGMNVPSSNSLSDSGVMPPTLPPTLPPSLPSMPNALQNSQSAQPTGGLSDYGANNSSANNYGTNAPAPIPQYNQAANQQLTNQQLANQQYNNSQYNNQPPAFDPYATQPNQVMPPNNPYRTVAAGDLRAVQGSGQPTTDPNNGLRPVAPTMPSGFGPNSRPIDIATGYPFVSPAPRTGNYPTSAYNPSLFRTVSYQNVVQAPMQAAPQSINVPNAVNIANTPPTLPQYQAGQVGVAPGVYPTQYQCAPGTAVYPAPGAVPGTYVPPTITPNLTPGSYSPNNSGYSPLFSLGQENYNVQIGRGIIGQPTVYVPGQPFRNFFRYLSP